MPTVSKSSTIPNLVRKKSDCKYLLLQYLQLHLNHGMQEVDGSISLDSIT